MREHRLQAGQDLGLHLEAGAEIYCASGVLRLHPAGGLGPRVLHTGQGWRAAHATSLNVEALQAGRCRVLAAPGTPLAHAQAAGACAKASPADPARSRLMGWSLSRR